MSTSGLSNDRRNFQCVTVAIVDLIIPVLIDILNSHIKPVALYQKIKWCLNLKLSKEQQAICFIPPPGVPDYNKFDVTLLYTLIRNLCSLPCPAQGWGNSNWPKATETQISDDIERLRLFRNNYYAHANSSKISDNIFKDIWGNLKSAISRIQSGYNIDYKDDLNRIELSKYTLSDWEECMKILNAITDKLKINIEGKNEIIHGHKAQFEADVHNVESSSWSVRWQKRNRDVIKCIDTDLERYSGSSKKTLVIQSVCKEDEGEYQAVLSLEINGPEYRSKNAIRLHVIGEKPFLKILKVISGSEAITIHFNSGVSKQSPEVRDIEWIKNGQPLHHDVKKYVGGGIHDSRFSILSPKLEDRGNYSCKVTNAVGSVSANVMLDVPNVELLEVAPVCCGSKTTIKSVISSTPTLEKVEWQKSKDGVVFYGIREEKDFEDTNSSTRPCFVIHNTSFVDKLYYRLLVWNGIGKNESNIVYLNVTGNLPCIKIFPETNIKNKSLKLIGNVIIYDDSPGMQKCFWTRNDKPIEFEKTDGKLSETRTDNPSLTITNVGPDDAGEYRLTAINAVGPSSDAIVLGVPCIFEEKTEDDNNGGQRITVTIKSIPEPCHVQWSAKRKEDEIFIPIDINAEEYKETTVTLSHPVLFVKQRYELENNCFRLEVTNFIGKTEHNISGNASTNQRKIDSVENTIYNDDGEDFKFTKLNSTLVKHFPQQKLDYLKFLIKKSNKIKNLTSVTEAKSVLECIDILHDENLFTRTDVIFMQFLCQEADCSDLFKKCVEYAECKQKALCYFKKPPVNGNKDVEFHVQGDVSGYTRAYINHVIKTVAVILDCKDEDILLNGVRHSKSFLISLSVKEIYIWKLLALQEKDRIKLKRLNIDYLIIDGKIIHLDRPKVSLLTMDHECRYQDVLRCNICDNLDHLLYCDICHVHLCKNCWGGHISDASADYTIVVPNKSLERGTKCPKHTSKICERYCEGCEIPVCVLCASSLEHFNHEFVDVEEKLESKKLILQKDLQELETSIYPKYQEIASNIPVKKAELNQNSRKLTTAISEHGEDLHREIDIAIEKMKSDVIEMESKHMAFLNKHEQKIQSSLFEITKSIAEVKKLLDSEDVCHVTAYKSRNAEFEKLSPTFDHLTLPRFTPQEINIEKINQYVGTLSMPPEHCNTMDAQGTESSHLISPLIDEARVITDINIKSGDSVLLTSVSCHSDALIWTCSINGNIMLLYDLLGELVKSVRTKSGRKPEDIAVTKNGDLVYTDYSDGSVNIVENTKIQTVVRLRDWRPRGVCSTNSGDLLVVEVRDEDDDDDDDDEQIKVVRYSESTEKTIIQYNNKGQSLPKGVFSNKYISENRNYDICVSDYRASAVVVFNQAGKRRFTYTGHLSTTKEPFYPCGITTDSQSCILTAEVEKGRIHILDQNGQFLRYIDNCDLHSPWGLCVDTRDNLFVTEFDSGKVKKIQYCI